ncbi:LCP family protein [Sporosarcina sp. JAI121]|uniref:LCP family protein n=1 Tax=Sporosarcina sp. JAI121 TaxID=2723064 RepID=UPI0015CE6405|nr:LCP family protein [Sporosarcina sp. JAI121]NYF25477.1 LCP family protein required for cell wall assembly [Sporosarcina sp. JAI121]
MKRSEQRKKKRKWLRNFLIVTTFVLLAGIVYVVAQYNSGLSIGKEGLAKEDDMLADEFKGADPQFGEINVLLLGSDSRGDDDARSDALMIAHYNQTTHQMKLVSIMRDTYVDIPEHGKHKMNAAFTLGGPELVRKTIKENFDVDIHYYAIVDFTGFSKIVDVVAPDGIEVDIPYAMSHGIGMTLQPGKQVLHGEQLLGYVRFRHDIQSDFGRVERQQEALAKVKEQAVSVHSLMNLPKLLGVVEPFVTTNVDKRTLFTIGKGLLVGKSEKIETLRIPVENSFENKREAAGAVLSIDFEKNKNALQQFLSTEDEEGMTGSDNAKTGEFGN